MRGRGVDEAGLVGDGVDDDALVIDGHALYARAEGREEHAGQRVARVFDGDAITGPQHGAGNDVDGLLGAGGDQNVLCRGLDAARDADVAGDGFAQASMAGRMSVGAKANGVRLELCGDEAAPRRVGKQRGVRDTGAEIELRGLHEGGGDAKAVPLGQSGEDAAGAGVTVVRAVQVEVADERTGTDARVDQSFTPETVVGHADRSA